MGTQFVPLAGCQASALERQTVLAASFIRLYKTGFSPNASTPRADYVAAEADFTGYPAGGFPVPAFDDPILSPGSGFQIGSPKCQFQTANPTTVGCVVAGGWLEDAAGIPRLSFTFDAPISMDAPFEGVPVTITLPFPSGQ